MPNVTQKWALIPPKCQLLSHDRYISIALNQTIEKENQKMIGATSTPLSSESFSKLYPIDPAKTFNVVFDIDQVLSDQKVRELNEIKFYQQRGLVLTAKKTHYIFPGVIEMMQLLFNMPDVRVSFFSSGMQCRNELFVKRLLKQALGKEFYLKIKENIRIFSGKKNDNSTDLVKNTSEQSEVQWKNYGLRRGEHKKSLEKVVGPEEVLDNCVLVDNDPKGVMCDQERNYLYVPPIFTKDYKAMESESKFYSYSVHGHKKIPFVGCLSVGNKESLKDGVINAEYIELLIESEKCTLGYADYEQKQYKEIELSQESDGALFAAIKAHYQKDKQGETMTKAELDLTLYTLLEEKQGKTTAINLSCNRICYVAGVLFKALEHARTGSTLADFLFPYHFSPKKENGAFEPLFGTKKANYNKEEYYHYGLEKLRQANPRFTFITPQIYNECCALAISAEEEAILKKIHENEEGCSIM